MQRTKTAREKFHVLISSDKNTQMILQPQTKNPRFLVCGKFPAIFVQVRYMTTLKCSFAGLTSDYFFHFCNTLYITNAMETVHTVPLKAKDLIFQQFIRYPPDVWKR